MVFSLLLVGAAFTAGFGVMLKELKNAPVASQDAHGFHIVPEATSDKTARTPHARIRRVRRQYAGHAGLKAFEPAHAR